MTKTELLCIKKSHVETALTEIEGRRSPAAIKHAEKHAGMFDEMFSRWQGLTQMRVENGVAIIPVRGTITPDDPFSAYYGETSLAMIGANFQTALADSKVKAIVLDIYSPGGYVYGVEALGNTIFAARGQKPITAFTGSLAASAAYWLASAADKVVLGSESSEVGSIGVYLAHFDYSAMLESMGIKVTEITSGEFKGLGSPYEALSEEDQEQMQKDVNYLMTRFVSTVARNRGMEVKEVLKSANGLTFYGSQAVARGLADSVNSIQEVIQMSTTTPQGATGAAATPAPTAGATPDPEKDALAATVTKQAAELAAYKAKEADEAAKAEEKAKTERAVSCQAAVKAALGRDATAEEVTLYESMSDDGRKVYAAQLAEQAKRTEALAARSGLFTEQALAGQAADDRTAENDPLVLAGKALGLMK